MSSTIIRAVNPNYRQINVLQKSLLAIGSGLTSIFDPTRDDMIATFGETSAVFTLNNIRNKMLSDSEGSLILTERPVINTKTVKLDYLSKLPENTFGKQYFNLLERDNITPDSRKPVQFVEDDELAYVMQRYREIHDFTHCLLGMRTNMLGEVTVKWFEAIQLNLPMCWLAGTFGSLRLGPKDSKKYINYYLPWIIDNALKSRFMMNVYYERYFDVPMDELRNTLNLTPPPVIIKKS